MAIRNSLTIQKFGQKFGQKSGRRPDGPAPEACRRPWKPAGGFRPWAERFGPFGRAPPGILIDLCY